MKNYQEQVLDDLNKGYLAFKDVDFNKLKCRLIAGNTVSWFYKEDEQYYSEEGEDVRKEHLYKGIVVPKDDIELSGGEIEAEDVMIVVIDEPCEKCYPESHWVSLLRLLTSDNLVEIYETPHNK